jgi:ABC-type uncharacterized transport system YnjBCD substrate-binding protein
MITEVGGYSGMGYAFGYWGNQTGIAYDPEQLAFEDAPQTIEDFEAFFAENPGRSASTTKTAARARPSSRTSRATSPR